MTAKPAKRILTVSDFNVENFNALLTNSEGEPRVEPVPASFGQPYQLLMDRTSDGWQEHPDVLLVWTRPEGVIEGFRRALRSEPFTVEDVLGEVDQFADAILAAAEDVATVLVPSWVLTGWERGLGLLNHRKGLGAADLLMRMNLRLSERLAESPKCVVLDAQRWIGQCRQRPFNPKSWYLAKIAFSNEVFGMAVEDVKAALRAVDGQLRKLLVLDLDDTLWGGIVGDVGWENLVLGGHDADGEALRDFQEGLKALTRRGILLGIASKNTESVALDAIKQHPEMVLAVDDFAGWRINWDDKARNIEELVAELNLGLQSVVFIDDNPAERARVREALPEVLVPEWPVDKSQYLHALQQLTCFDAVSLTAEDRKRSEMYASERERRVVRTKVGSVDEWLGTLGITVRVEAMDGSNLTRATQLLNKTNQMNMRTRRLSESQFQEWASAPGNAVWALRVTDKFGDLGLTGLLGVAAAEDCLRIEDFVLSCRVMGRRIEDAMLALAVDHARGLGLPEVVAAYEATAKNQPCLDFLMRSGMSEADGDRVFRIEATVDLPEQKHLTVVRPGGDVESRSVA